MRWLRTVLTVAAIPFDHKINEYPPYKHPPMNFRDAHVHEYGGENSVAAVVKADAIEIAEHQLFIP